MILKIKMFATQMHVVLMTKILKNKQYRHPQFLQKIRFSSK